MISSLNDCYPVLVLSNINLLFFKAGECVNSTTVITATTTTSTSTTTTTTTTTTKATKTTTTTTTDVYLKMLRPTFILFKARLSSARWGRGARAGVGTWSFAIF